MRDTLQQVEDRLAIQQLIRRAGLSERQIEVLDLYYFGGMNFRQIAEQWQRSWPIPRIQHDKAIHKFQRVLTNREWYGRDVQRWHYPYPIKRRKPRRPRWQPPSVVEITAHPQFIGNLSGNDLCMVCDGCGTASPSIRRTEMRIISGEDAITLRKLLNHPEIGWHCTAYGDWCPKCRAQKAA